MLVEIHGGKRNGKNANISKLEKKECIRPKCPLSMNDAKRIVGDFIIYYNMKRLHSSIGYIAPYDKLTGREKQIFEERDCKFADAREKRKNNRRRLKQIIKEQICSNKQFQTVHT